MTLSRCGSRCAIALAGLATVAAACSTSPPGEQAARADAPAATAATAVAAVAAAPKVPTVPAGPATSSPGELPLSVIDRPLPVDNRPKPQRIETSGGVSVLAVLPLQCPTAGGRPFARWLATAGVVDERLTSAGVDGTGRDEAARLAVDWARGERLLLVHGGDLPNPGHRLGIDSIRRPPGGAVQVAGRLIAPAPGSIQLQVIANPCQLIHLADPGAAAGTSDIELTLTR